MNVAQGGKRIMRRKAAVSLIELLVAVAIVAILAALLFPAFKKYEERSQSVQCLGNLKKYASLAMLYAGDHNGDIPVKTETGFFQRVLSYYPDPPKNTPKWVCPAFVKYLEAKLGVHAPNPLTIWWTGYNGNTFFEDMSGLAGVGNKRSPAYSQPGRLSQISTFSKTPLYFDMDTTKQGSDAAGRYLTDGSMANVFWPAHGRTFNIAFFDGHVQSVPFNDAGPGQGTSPADYPEYVWKPY